MATTTNMALDLPTVSITLGPEWATKLNEALERIDIHDHSSNLGVKITPAGMNINDDLDFNENSASELKSLKLISNSSTLTGAANQRSLYSSGGNLYFTNAAGTAVQITDGSSLLSSPAAVETVSRQAVSADLTISPSSSFVFLEVDTSAARSITLPLASGVSDGRIYIIKDSTGQSDANNITLNAAGSDTIDGASSVTLDSPYGSWWVIGDGNSAWYIN